MDNQKLSALLGEQETEYAISGNRMDLVELSRKGIKKSALFNLTEILGISMKELARLLPITERTIQRRKPDSLLSSAVSDQAILIAEVAEKAMEVFEDEKTLKKWMQESNISLGGQTPLSLLDTSIGAQLVMDELGKLAYGVYS